MISDRCRELEEGLRTRLTAAIDHGPDYGWLDSFSGIEECIVEGLRRCRLAGDWTMFEKYVLAADRHPSTRYTAELCEAFLHHREEINNDDVLFALAGIKDPASISCLEEMIWWESEWDEYRHLAIKAVWTLKAIGTPEALAVLEDTVTCAAEPVRKAAAEALARANR